jgi:D-galactarolactone cycloisomerase
MSGVPVVEHMEVWPLEYPLHDARYGGSRRLAYSRATTLVKLTSSDGVVGWGEAFGPPLVNAAHLRAIAARVIGAPIDQTEYPMLKDLAHGYHLTSGGTLVTALSAVDLALWDVWARTLGVGVASLLGGRARDHVHAYASTGYVTAEGGTPRFRAELERAVADGFSAVKIKIGTGLRDDVERTVIAREVFGDDGVVMVDYNANYTVGAFRDSVAAIRELRIGWYEEPLPPEDGAGYRELRSLGVPIAAGEALYTRFGFRDHIAERRYDIVQPDPTTCGGLTEYRIVTQMAAAWGLRVSPHCWGGGLAQAITLQALAALDDHPYGDTGASVHYLEADRGTNPLREEMLTQPIRIVAGEVEIPEGPGFGVEIDEDAMRRYLADGGVQSYGKDAA